MEKLYIYYIGNEETPHIAKVSERESERIIEEINDVSEYNLVHVGGGHYINKKNVTLVIKSKLSD
jgi:hypothetical protein